MARHGRRLLIPNSCSHCADLPRNAPARIKLSSRRTHQAPIRWHVPFPPANGSSATRKPPAVRTRRGLEPIDSCRGWPGLHPDVPDGIDPAAHTSPTGRTPCLSHQRKIRVPPLLGLAPPMIILGENRCDKNYHASGAPGTRHGSQGSGRFGSSPIMGGPHALWVSRCDQRALRETPTPRASARHGRQVASAPLDDPLPCSGLRHTSSMQDGPMEGAGVV